MISLVCVSSIPEARAGVDNPVSGGLLTNPLLHERLLGPKELHGELVVRGREYVLQLALHPARTARLRRHRVPGHLVIIDLTLVLMGGGGECVHLLIKNYFPS